LWLIPFGIVDLTNSRSYVPVLLFMQPADVFRKLPYEIGARQPTRVSRVTEAATRAAFSEVRQPRVGD
jgi:hypothetical protein